MTLSLLFDLDLFLVRYSNYFEWMHREERIRLLRVLIGNGKMHSVAHMFVPNPSCSKPSIGVGTLPNPTLITLCPMSDRSSGVERCSIDQLAGRVVVEQ